MLPRATSCVGDNNTNAWFRTEVEWILVQMEQIFQFEMQSFKHSAELLNGNIGAESRQAVKWPTNGIPDNARQPFAQFCTRKRCRADLMRFQ